MDPATARAGSARAATESRGEAARLEARLAVASDRLDALMPSPHQQGSPSPRPRARVGVTRLDDDDVDSDLRELLRPAAARVTRLLELAGSVADGTMTDAAAAEAARGIAGTQPHRRTR